MRSTWSLLACLSLALAAPVAADETTGVLEVRVYRGSSKVPAAGAVVGLSGGGGAQLSRQAVANAVGRARFERLPIGVYDLNAFFAGHVYRGVGGSRESVVIRAGESVEQELTVRAKPIITGEVSDPEGRPLAGVKVRLLRPTYARRGSTVEEAESTTTDDRGVYRFALETPGLYWVLASRFEREFLYGGGRPVGFAFSPDAPDLAGAQAVDAAFDQPEARRDVRLPWAPAAALTARVRSGRGGEGCPRCSYVLLGVAGDARYPIHDGFVRPHEPPKSYSVRVPGLSARRYRLEVRDSRSYEDYWSASGEVAPSDAGDVYALRTRPPVVVSGRVEVPDTVQPTETRGRRRGRRAPSLRLTMLPDGRKLPPFFAREAQVAEDGSFEAAPTAAGLYELTVRIDGYGYVAAIERDGRALASPVLDLADGGDWSDLKVVIRRETAEFRPTLTGVEDERPRSYRMLLTPLDDDFTQPAYGFCAARGRCSADDIVPGRYAVRVVPETGERGRLPRLRHDPSLKPWTREIELRPGENVQVTLSPVPDDALDEF